MSQKPKKRRRGPYKKKRKNPYPRTPQKPGAQRFFKGGKPTKKQLKDLRELASNGINQKIIAAHFGVSIKTFARCLAEKKSPMSLAYYRGYAEARENIMNKLFHLATTYKEGEGHPVLLMFLGKTICGLTEKPDTSGDIADRAQAIRETVDKMNSGLAEFQDKDGNFKDPDAPVSSKKPAVSSPPPIAKKKKKKRLVRAKKK